jgi:hypothetical protein
MDPVALNILNEILSAAAPDSLVCLPVNQALALGRLGPRELGRELKAFIDQTSVVVALQLHGLFGRQIRVVYDRADFTVNCVSTAST